ncbi:cobyric acid synthase [Coralliovum pocilloporae]|uniref:cobyric acid synthase n=1 Tax=Coralliovum pocilloporae TaxID=3066369 RepID=UPI003307744E
MKQVPAIMLQGTGSNVGKSMLVAGLCRALLKRGYNVRPFKPQNMSNNAAATDDGGEIGRAQALQARACNIPTNVHMNPVLLKPESDQGSQVIVQGKRFGTMKARDYFRNKGQLLSSVLESFETLSDGADIVVVEGAGSAAEVNLRAGDIANMGFAEAARVPVVLIGDIDRGGVIASLVGTHGIVSDSDRALIKGFLINKFRGDPTLFDEGALFISERTGWDNLGVLPWFSAAGKLPAEDSVDLDTSREKAHATFRIAVPRLPRIANFDDLDPLHLEDNVSVTLVEAGDPIPADTDLIILPGSKSTIADFNAVKEAGWDIDIKAHARRGGAVLGLCGGYQMLGRMIHDPNGIEGPAGSTEGLGLLDVETELTETKQTRLVSGVHCPSGLAVQGYEIHLGETTGPDCARPVAEIAGISDGAISADGRIVGTYLHGFFGDDALRRHVLNGLKPGVASDLAYEQTVDDTLDRLAEHVEAHLDVDALIRIASSR